MSDTLKQDSTKTFKPIIYQFIIALEKCFEMQNDESVWIEKYGDVTSSNGEQIEVKDYQKDLTDLDHNIWKTLQNWLDDEFDVFHYDSFVLLTTQKISEASSFIDWNNMAKNNKFKILHSISEKFNEKEKKSESTQKLLSNVLDNDKKNKLLFILGKFTIHSEYIKDEKLYNKIIETRTDGILLASKYDYIDALLGYIINPRTTSHGWEIKNKEFRQKATSLIETYTSTTKIFPKIDMSTLTQDAIGEHQSYLFVEKIKDIEYDEVASDAINDFIYARNMLNQNLKNYEISKQEYDSYEEQVFRSFENKHRQHSRRANSSNSINVSKDLYDKATDDIVPNFYHFNDTPKQYRNGLLHEIADDEKNPTKLIWKIKINDE